MIILLYFGLAAACIQIMCAHNEHYGAAAGWGAIQMAIFWVYLLSKGS